jgi:predicted nucleotidyltransferase
VLFTASTQRLLALLFGQADRRFGGSELIQLAGMGTGAIHRQLQRMVRAGLVRATTQGNQRFYQARIDAPIFEQLRTISVKSFGVEAQIGDALAGVADSIIAAFVFGSEARGAASAQSDIDVLVVSDSLDYVTLFDALGAVESRTGRTISLKVMTLAQWRRRASDPDSLVSRLKATERRFVIGSDGALG